MNQANLANLTDKELFALVDLLKNKPVSELTDDERLSIELVERLKNHV